MTSDDSDAILSYNLDDDSAEDLPKRSYWWSLYRPETYAIVALVLGMGSLISIGPAQEVAQAILLNFSSRSSEQDLLYALSGIRLGIAFFAILSAVISIRSEDDDSTWSPPVARAAILVAVLTATLSAIALIVNATISDTSGSQF